MPAARHPELSHTSEPTSSKRLFSNSSSLLPLVLISVLLSFTLRGFHFSLYCYVLCAASEVVKGQLDLPSPLAGRQEALYCWCIWISLLPAVRFLHLHGTSQHTPALLFSDSPQQRTPQVQCLCCSWSLGWAEMHLLLWASHGAVTAPGWALLLLGAHVAHLKPYTWTLQQCKPTLYCLPAKGCSAWCSLFLSSP